MKLIELIIELSNVILLLKIFFPPFIYSVHENLPKMFKFLQIRANQKQLKLSWEVDKNVLEHLVGDVGRL